jgi:hypothetical protein
VVTEPTISAVAVAPIATFVAVAVLHPGG